MVFLPLLLLLSVTFTSEPPVEEPIRLETLTGVIDGTLMLPSAARGRVPVALLIAGSGPTDRNGNSAELPGANDSLRLLAAGLAADGIASVRYDKRGIGKSAAAAPAESALRFDTYVDDAVGWLKRLQADERFRSVVVVGHSEGSLIGMLAAKKGHAAKFVSIAGAGRPAGVLLREQLRGKLTPELEQQSERILESLEAGVTVADTPAPLAPLFRPSVQPYLISWLRIDPAAEMARLDIPSLIVQGTADLQATVDDARALQRANGKAELLLITGMNHVLKAVEGNPAKQTASYSDPSLRIVPELIRRIRSFIQR